MTEAQTFSGVVIVESLEDASVLEQVRIIETIVEPVTEEHRTPWVKQWTMHTVEVEPDAVAAVADLISHALDSDHHWYADLKSDREHYVIYRNKVFHITDRSDKTQYDAATEYGISIGIPEYQVDFSPHVRGWNRQGK